VTLCPWGGHHAQRCEAACVTTGRWPGLSLLRAVEGTLVAPCGCCSLASALGWTTSLQHFSSQRRWELSFVRRGWTGTEEVACCYPGSSHRYHPASGKRHCVGWAEHPSPDPSLGPLLGPGEPHVFPGTRQLLSLLGDGFLLLALLAVGPFLLVVTSRMEPCPADRKRSCILGGEGDAEGPCLGPGSGGGVVLSPRQMLTSLRAQGAVTVQGAWHPVVVAPKGSV
jgi:hypothetical protein